MSRPSGQAFQPSFAPAFRTVLCVAAMVALAACGTPQATRFHSLLSSPLEGPRPDDVKPAGPSLEYELAPIGIPEQVDRPQMVVRNGDGSLLLLENERWIAPLPDELRAALSERLLRTFGATEARQLPPGHRPSHRLTIEVLRFDSIPAGQARIEAAWSLRPLDPGGTAMSCRDEIRQSAGPGYVGLAAAHREAVVLLADQIGRAMRSIKEGSTLQCP